MSVFSNNKKLTENRLTSTITATPENQVKLTESSWNKSPTNLGVRKSNRFSKNSSGFFTAESKKSKKKNKKTGVDENVDKMSMNDLKKKAKELNLSDDDVRKFGDRRERKTYIEAIKKNSENTDTDVNTNTNVDNNNEQIIIAKRNKNNSDYKKNGDKKDKKGKKDNALLDSLPSVSSGGTLKAVGLATAYYATDYARQLFTWTKESLTELGQALMYIFAGFVGFFAFLRLYDTYTKKVEEYENLESLDDEALEVKINELYKELCYWDGTLWNGYQARPECKLIRAEYKRAIKIKKEREEAREEEEAIREEEEAIREAAGPAYDKLKYEYELQHQKRINANLRDKLLDNVSFCKLIIQTAEEKTNYKATEDDIIKLSEEFNNHQKLWKIDVPVKDYISDTEFYINRKILFAGNGELTNDIFYPGNSKLMNDIVNQPYFGDLKQRARLLARALMYCSELHVNKVIAWMRIEKELKDEIESSGNNTLKRNFVQQWKHKPTGKARNMGIYADIQKLKVPTEMTYEKMLEVSVDQINESLKHLNDKYITKLPDEIREKFRIIENNMNGFKCYRTFQMMSSFKLIKAANEFFKRMKNNSKELENLEKDTKKWKECFKKLKDSHNMYKKYMKAHTKLRSDNLSPEFIKNICDKGEQLSTKMFDKPWKLATFIINEGIKNIGKPEQKNKKRPKESIMNKVKQQFLMNESESSEESESEEEGENKDIENVPLKIGKKISGLLMNESESEEEGEKVPLKIGQKISGHRIEKDGQEKVYTGKIVKIHKKDPNIGKVQLEIEPGKTIAHVIPYTKKSKHTQKNPRDKPKKGKKKKKKK